MGFNVADIEQLETYKAEAEAAVTEFEQIKKDFESLNRALLVAWKGEGADAYDKFTDDILKEIGNFGGIIEKINKEVVDKIIEEYSKADEDLAEFNAKQPEN